MKTQETLAKILFLVACLLAGTIIFGCKSPYQKYYESQKAKTEIKK